MSKPVFSQKNTDFITNILMKQSEDLKTAGQRVLNLDENDHVVMLVEPRNHPMLEAVVRNVMYFMNGLEDTLPGKWNLHIFCGTENEQAIRDAFPDWKIKLTNLGVPNMNANMHNKLLLQIPFWKTINEENILVIQTDVMMFRPMPEYLTSFDFIGAVYLNPNERTPDGKGFNGGFNFRKKSAVLDCLNRVSIADVENYRKSRAKNRLPSLEYHNRIAEDVFMNHSFEMLEKKFPTEEDACKFSTEAIYTKDSVGIHGWQWSFFPFEKLDQMVKASELKKYIL